LAVHVHLPEKPIHTAGCVYRHNLTTCTLPSDVISHKLIHHRLVDGDQTAVGSLADVETEWRLLDVPLGTKRVISGRTFFTDNLVARTEKEATKQEKEIENLGW